jgi:hypothetical protein
VNDGSDPSVILKLNCLILKCEMSAKQGLLIYIYLSVFLLDFLINN